ncbi:hypothetical protein RhiXN_08170 [Rhizoctonia solani]|uniref:Uncharacterized protein n=1 Tax=Rhizoctonia solani TaxID=456999 RepID=A0A8H8P076_9AGAM|nr:uncharacterized protein RhiXN_08170 [Rhizoctonia solani]QRW23134.1 hypothetical protein RhiXN_08170 [Rhizoctonia solani]
MKFSLAALFTLALSPCLVGASPVVPHLNSTLSEAHLISRAESTQKFASYAAASVASCKWVNQGKTKVVPKNLVLYTSRLKSSPAYDKVVGLGLKTNAGSVTPLVRIDMDNTGKGIHFNAVQLDNSQQKLAAVLTSTVGMTQAARTSLYLDYLKGIENRSPEFLWNWWNTGKAN